MNFRHKNLYAPTRLRTEQDLRKYFFQEGTLFCRWVHIVELHPTGQSCGGESRRIYKREAQAFANNEPVVTPSTLGKSKEHSSSSANGRREHAISSGGQKRALSKMPTKNPRLTLGDGYCGVGGVSEGGSQADYKILWGLEKCPQAMAAYRKNFPGALHLEMDAHDFPSIVRRSTHGCDHLHMSCPCCFWSEAQLV